MGYKIIQIMPNTDDRFKMGAEHSEESENSISEIVCWALIELDDGSTKVTPMIRVPYSTELIAAYELVVNKKWINFQEG